jgi:hypothetical protein
MGAKAVYNNQSVMIYITGADVDQLLKELLLWVPVYIGKTPVPPLELAVHVPNDFRGVIAHALEGERGSIERVRSQLYAAHPEIAKGASRRREERRQRAKRTHSPDVPG